MVDFKTDYLAKGDGQLQTLTVSYSPGTTTTLRVFSNTFVSGDVGKWIAVQDWVLATGANPAGAVRLTIGAVGTFASGHQDVTLTGSAAVNTATSASKSVEWGSDDRSAIESFNTAQAGNSGVVLTVPAGRYIIVTGAGGGGSSVGFGQGVKSMTVNGTGGPTFSDLLGVGSGPALNFNGAPMTNVDNTNSSLIQTIAAGQTVLHMVTTADAAKYTTNTWAWLTGFDLQGEGWPPNPWVSEFVFITAVNTGTVTISVPLKNSYKSTWPSWQPGGVGIGASLGGPATLYLLDQAWDADHTWNGVNFRATPTLQNGCARSITINNSTFEAFGPNVSFQKTFMADNLTLLTNWELDKGTETVLITNSNIHGFNVQSSSPFDVTLNNVTFAGTNGTAKNWTMTNCSVPAGMLWGPSAFGGCTSATTSNCTFAGQSIVGGVLEGDLAGAGAYTISSGVISRVKSAGTAMPPQWAMPGGYFFFGSQYHYEGRAIRVLDITDDGTSIHIFTDYPGSAWPPIFSGTSPHAISSPPPNFAFTGNTGCDDAVSWSAVTGHLYSKWLRTYSGVLAYDPAVHGVKVSGKFVSAKITVTSGYTAGTMTLDGPFVLQPPSNTRTTWSPSIDLTATGTRQINPDGSVTNGQSGDSGLGLPNSGNVWLLDDQITPHMSGAVGTGTVTLEINADLGYGVPGVAPLRLRLKG